MKMTTVESRLLNGLIICGILLGVNVFFGPGYRVYFGEDGKDIVILLCGGDKGSQQDDIRKAKAYWKEYNEREKLSNSR